MTDAHIWSIRLSQFVISSRRGEQAGHTESKFDVETDMLKLVTKFSKLKTGDPVKGQKASGSPPYIVVT